MLHIMVLKDVLHCYCDADFAMDLNDQKSQSSFLLMFTWHGVHRSKIAMWGTPQKLNILSHMQHSMRSFGNINCWVILDTDKWL
jgi:hypothetical protein